MEKQQTSKYGFYWQEAVRGVVWIYWNYIIRKESGGYTYGFMGPGSKSYVMKPELHQTFEETEEALDEFIRKLGTRCGC